MFIIIFEDFINMNFYSTTNICVNSIFHELKLHVVLRILLIQKTRRYYYWFGGV